jgi:hypothetical protein
VWGYKPETLNSQQGVPAPLFLSSAPCCYFLRGDSAVTIRTNNLDIISVVKKRSITPRRNPVVGLQVVFVAAPATKWVIGYCFRAKVSPLCCMVHGAVCPLCFLEGIFPFFVSTAFPRFFSGFSGFSMLFTIF